MNEINSDRPAVAIIGGGPAGLMAAERLAPFARVTVYERMPSVGRKFLMAGRGGLNLTHGEGLDLLLSRYGAARGFLAPAIAGFPPAALVGWCEGLGQATFVGSSGRVFPRAFKASPLLRAWLGRLRALGVTVRTRQDWLGWDASGGLCFSGGVVRADATVLALGGASWPRLGADGGWVGLLGDVPIEPLRPANVGFLVDWSAVFRARFEGVPLKRIGLRFGGLRVLGEAMITGRGLEGGVVYALSAPLRDAIAAGGPVEVAVDLRPDFSLEQVAERLSGPRGALSFSNFLRKSLGLSAVAIGLVQEALHGGAVFQAGLIKALPLKLLAAGGIERAISTAGGIAFSAVDADFMLRARPGVFVAGEMLDWEAPTGGYLLQACFSTGVAAAQGVVKYLASIS